MPLVTTMPATDALAAWLSSSTDAGDAAWKEDLADAVDGCQGNHVALCVLLARFDRLASHCPRHKWKLLTQELRLMEAQGVLGDHQTVRTQLLKLELRLPASDVTVVQIMQDDKRLSMPALRTANSLEAVHPPAQWLTRSARSLRRVLTVDDSDRQLPLLERRTTASSQRELTSSLTRSFRNRMSTVLQGGFEETFFCFICFENAPVHKAFALSLCGHQYCRGCLARYLETKIRDGEVYPTCFHDIEDTTTQRRVACASPVIPPDIDAAVSPAAWTKYERFKFNKEFEHARECPFCSHSQSCRGPEYPECECEKCKHVFCFTHSNAHEGSSCADFERKNMASEKLSRAAIASIAKPCPGCKNNVEKSGGCNHMTCIACQTSFCWICGKVVDNVTLPDHYAWWNISGCAGQQLVDVEHQSRVERVGWLLFRVLFLTVCVPIATVITVVLTVLTGCCIPCICWIHEDPQQTFLGTVNTVALYVQLVIAVVVVAPITVVAVLFRCVRSCFCTCCFWPSQPRASEFNASVFVLEGEYSGAQDDAIDL